MYFDFSTILLLLSLTTGLVWLFDVLFLKPNRKQKAALTVTSNPQARAAMLQESKFVEYCRSFFPIFVIVLLLRAFIAEPYRIPTGSMKPTLLEGDFVLVNKFIYGLRLPVTGTKVMDVSSPQRGDIMVFRFPVNPSVNFIKRIVGLPGDKVKYKNKILYVNGEAMELDVIGQDIDMDERGREWKVKRLKEHLNGVTHDIFLRPFNTNEQEEVTVPKGQYFVLGDNRDNSEDGRVWGFVDDKYILGKAFGIWLSWDAVNKDVRWHRIGSKLS